MRATRYATIPGLLVGALLLTGCVRRTITITSEPSGALCWLNGREIGRTPVEVDFLYYGTYDVQLVADGHEPLLTSGEAKAPIWDSIPIDLVAEMVPGKHESRIAWHYRLDPRNDDSATLLERARALRSRIGSTPESSSATTAPAATMPVER